MNEDAYLPKVQLWRLAIVMIGLGPMVAAACPASAEWFVDLYGGASIAADADVTIRNGTTVEDKAKFDTEGMGGARLGCWLEGATRCSARIRAEGARSSTSRRSTWRVGHDPLVGSSLPLRVPFPLRCGPTHWMPPRCASQAIGAPAASRIRRLHGARDLGIVGAGRRS
jgi:hypothetical protein